MKKSTIEKIEQEISEKTKLPYELKEKIRKEVFTNIAVASAIILYFIFIVLGSIGSIKNVRVIDINIFSMLFLSIAILLFEIAYRKDDGKLAMFGIESLVVAIFTLFLPYIIFELHETNKKYYLIASICIAIYYIVKSIYIAMRTKNKHIRELSDIKEIVKKEKTKRRIKEEIEEIEEPKKGIKEEKKTSKSVKTDKTKAITKKQSKVEISEKTEKKESAPKKRGKPKN